MSKFSFKRGFSQLTIRDVKSARKELMEALGIGTRAGFLKRLKGEVEPKASEVEKIEAVFEKYGIVDIWGED